MTYTKGPWHWEEDADIREWGLNGLEPAVLRGTVEGHVLVDDADALLIAAAPDLLEALKAIVQNDQWDFRQYVRQDILTQADKAIAKAEGPQQ